MSLRKKFSIRIGIGAPSLITIFLVLSLVSFSVLSYLTALADYRFATNSAQRTTAFYEANNLAENKIGQLENLLASIPHEQQTDFFEQAYQLLTQYPLMDDASIVLQKNNSYPGEASLNYSFIIIVRENMELQVAVAILPFDNSSDTSPHRFTHITRWQIVQTQEWEADNHLNLL